MATYGGFDFTNFRGVNLKNTAAIRVLSEGYAHTLAVKEAADQPHAWHFPQKSGTFPIAGTFSVHMPAVGAGAFSGTSVTVTGIRAEDGLVCTLQDTFNTVTTDRGFAALVGAAPANGGAYLTFFNFGSTATIYNELIVAYAAVR